MPGLAPPPPVVIPAGTTATLRVFAREGMTDVLTLVMDDVPVATFGQWPGEVIAFEASPSERSIVFEVYSDQPQYLPDGEMWYRQWEGATTVTYPPYNLGPGAYEDADQIAGMTAGWFVIRWLLRFDEPAADDPAGENDVLWLYLWMPPDPPVPLTTGWTVGHIGIFPPSTDT